MQKGSKLFYRSHLHTLLNFYSEWKYGGLTNCVVAKNQTLDRFS